MAEFGSRSEELTSSLHALAESDFKSVGENGAEGALALSRHTLYLEAIGRYAEWREKALLGALDFLKQDVSSSTSRQSKWSEQLCALGTEACRQLTELSKDLKPTIPGLYAFANQVGSQESAFYNQLSRLQLVAFQSRLKGYVEVFTEEQVMLGWKWAALGDGVKPVQQKYAELKQAILTVFNEVVGKLIEAQYRGPESWSRLATQDGGDPPADVDDVVIGFLKQQAGFVLDLAENLRKSKSEYAAQVMLLHSQEETLVVLVAQIRDDVRRFLQQTNLDAATKEFAQLTSDSQTLASGCQTDKQQRDAKRFVELALNLVAPQLDAFKGAYSNFVDKNREIFVGPMGSAALDAILKTDARARDFQDIDTFGLQGKLLQLHTDIARTWVVNINGLSEDARKDLQNRWSMELERLGTGLVAAADDDNFAVRLKGALVDYSRILWDRLKGSKGGLE